jgi:anti-anti-sigma factor
MPWSRDPHLRVSIVYDGAASATVRLAGEIDFASVGAARHAVLGLSEGTRRIVLDLSRVTYCDAAGIRFLIAARRLARRAGADLVVRYPLRSVARLLDLTGTLRLICPDISGAGVPVPDAAVSSACAVAVAEAMEVSGADAGNAQLVDPASGVLRIVAEHGFEREFLDFFEIVHDEESACGTALAAGEPVWVPEVAMSPIFAGTPALDVMLGAGARAVASLPVQAHDGRVIAMISVHHRRPTDWTKAQRQHLAEIAAATGRLLSIPGAMEPSLAP